MKWVLVLIALESVDASVTPGGVYDGMTECFAVREYIMKHESGARPAQAVCIRTDWKQASAAFRELKMNPAFMR